MKHLLNGVVIAAALAIAAPAWSQTPATPAPKTVAPAAPMAPMAPMQRHKRMPMHHMAKGSSNRMSDQLNREELARIQGGGGVVPPPTPTGFAGQPSPTTGIPGGGQPSASSHATPQSPMPPR